ncbi:MAG: hypothetical protein A2749_00155 [Parcubacteria group bacterium RIFCSPHIGHO2_01_FULL_45_26]|nr:MAG: hypothetical protein A2749_00155 [Parcubacteria group bacterium RIFCSPHIGHO2_01_FULL_45_26]
MPPKWKYIIALLLAIASNVISVSPFTRGWPNAYFLVGVAFSIFVIVMLYKRRKELRRGWIKVVYSIILTLLIITMATMVSSILFVLGVFAFTPNIGLDDFAGLLWLYPALFGMIHFWIMVISTPIFVVYETVISKNRL